MMHRPTPGNAIMPHNRPNRPRRVGRWLRNRQFYVQLVLSLVLVAVLSTLAVSTMLSQIYVQDLKDRLNGSSIDSLGRIAGEFDNVVLQLRQMNIYLRQSPDIGAFLSAPRDDYIIGNKANLYFGSVTNMNTYLYSVVLYNPNMSFVLTSGKMGVNPGQFRSAGAQKLGSYPTYTLYRCEIHRTDLPASKPFQSVALVFREQGGADSGNAIIMTLDKGELEKRILNAPAGELFLLNAEGDILFRSMGPGEPSPGQRACFGQVVLSGQDSGIFPATVDAADRIVTYNRSRETGLYLVHMASANAFMQSVTQRVRLVLALSAAVFLLLCALAFVLSGTLYRPMKKLKETCLQDGATGGANELDALSRVFRDTFAQVKTLQSMCESSSCLLRQDYLRDLLKKGPQALDAYDEDLPQGSAPDLHGVYPVCLRIDNYARMDENTRIPYQAAVAQIVREALDGRCSYEIANLFDGEIALVLGIDNAAAQDAEPVIARMDALREAVAQRLVQTVTVGIGPQASGPADVHLAYRKAAEAARHRFLFGRNRTIYSHFTDPMQADDSPYPQELEDRLIQSIKAGNADAFAAHMEQIAVVLCGYSLRHASSMLFQILYSAMHTMLQIGGQGGKAAYEVMASFQQGFAALETLHEARDWMVALFADHLNRIEEAKSRRSDKHYAVVEAAKAFIHSNYGDMTLSVDSIANVVGYAPYYFTRIFKAAEKTNINDYIRQARMTKAQELLIRTDTRIADIAALVGIPSASYFFTVFKEQFGLTPTAYRDLFRRSR